MVLPVPQNTCKFLIAEETENISIFVVSAMNDIYQFGLMGMNFHIRYHS